MDLSIINYYGEQQSRCGYCKNTNSSASHGMHAFNLTSQDYQDLLDRGWRRCGLYCYKPQNSRTCCPCYTIKCDATEFKPSKSHKKILKRMTRFLRDGKKDKNEEQQTSKKADDPENDAAHGGGILEAPPEPDVPLPNVDLEAVTAANVAICAAAKKLNEHFDDKPQQSINLKAEQNERAQVGSVASSSFGSQDSSKKSYDASRPPCKKAKQIRLERRQAKLAAKGITEPQMANKTSQQQQEKSLADYFAEASPTDKHKLKLVLVHAKGREFANTLATSFALYSKYQTSIHNDPPDHVNDYLEFLQISPLKHQKTHDGPSAGYGSFHQQYWLDDKLIAVAVIDILPYCVSSVYFFYDPDYSFLSLGTYGSLRELALVQELAAKVPALKYYYMGYYIHSCAKMRYKGKLVPSQLLCPETYTWHLITDAIRAKLDAQKYQRLNVDLNARDVDEFKECDLEKVMLLDTRKRIISYGEYIQITGDNDDREEILEYGKLVGKTCANRMLYFQQ